MRVPAPAVVVVPVMVVVTADPPVRPTVLPSCCCSTAFRRVRCPLRLLVPILHNFRVVVVVGAVRVGSQKLVHIVVEIRPELRKSTMGRRDLSACQSRVSGRQKRRSVACRPGAAERGPTGIVRARLGRVAELVFAFIRTVGRKRTACQLCRRGRALTPFNPEHTPPPTHTAANHEKPRHGMTIGGPAHVGAVAAVRDLVLQSAGDLLVQVPQLRGAVVEGQDPDARVVRRLAPRRCVPLPCLREGGGFAAVSVCGRQLCSPPAGETLRERLRGVKQEWSAAKVRKPVRARQTNDLRAWLLAKTSGFICSQLHE